MEKTLLEAMKANINLLQRRLDSCSHSAAGAYADITVHENANAAVGGLMAIQQKLNDANTLIDAVLILHRSS